MQCRQNIYSSYRSFDLAFPFKGAVLFACYTLVVEESAAADAEPQKHKIVIHKFGQQKKNNKLHEKLNN